MANASKELIRWTIARASVEFGPMPNVLTQWLNRGEQHPGADGKYSTRQILRAVAGDIDAEKLRETRHKANLLELEEMEMRRQMIPADQVAATWEAIIVGLRQGVLNSELPEQKKRDLLDDLRQIPLDDYFKTAKPVDDEAE